MKFLIIAINKFLYIKYNYYIYSVKQIKNEKTQ